MNVCVMYMCIRICMCVCVYVHMYIRMSVCAYVCEKSVEYTIAREKFKIHKRNFST